MPDDSGVEATIERDGEVLRVDIPPVRTVGSIVVHALGRGAGYGLVVAAFLGAISLGAESASLAGYAALVGFVPVFVLVFLHSVWVQLPLGESTEFTVSKEQFGLEVRAPYGPRLTFACPVDEIENLQALEMTRENLLHELPPESSYAMTLLLPDDIYTFGYGLTHEEAERIAGAFEEFVYEPRAPK